MPQVGDKHFAYTPAGKSAAAAYSQDTGKPVHAKKKRQAKMHSATTSKKKQSKPSGWRINKAENGYVVHTDYPIGDMLRMDSNEKPMVFSDVEHLVSHLKDSLP